MVDVRVKEMKILHKPSARVSGFSGSNKNRHHMTYSKTDQVLHFTNFLPVTKPKMSTLELRWTRLILCTTELYAPVLTDDSEATIQWHCEGSTLYIVMNNDRQEIDLRLEREMFDVKVGPTLVPINTFESSFHIAVSKC
jgi:hypothetical protein